MEMLKIIPFHHTGSFLSECHRLSLSVGLELCGARVCINSVKRHSPSQGAPVWVEDEIQRRYGLMGKYQVRLK